MLSRHDWREYDQKIVLYTANAGKIELTARGVKKSTAKNSSSLEPGTIIAFTPAHANTHGRTASAGQLLTSVEPLAVFSNIQQHLEASLYAQYGLALTATVTELEQPEERLFGLLVQWLAHLNAAPLFSAWLTMWFVAQFINILGFTPELQVCVLCGKELGEHMSISYAHGGFLCAACSRAVGLTVVLEPLNQKERTLFTSFFSGPVAQMSSEVPALEVAEELLFGKILSRYLAFQTGYKIPSPGHLAELAKV